MTLERKLFSVQPENTATMTESAKRLEERLRNEVSKAREEFNDSRIPDDAEFVTTYINQILSSQRLNKFGRDRTEKENILFNFGINTVMYNALEALSIDPRQAVVSYDLLIGGICLDCLEGDFKSHRSSKRFRGILERANPVSRSGNTSGNNQYNLNSLLYSPQDILMHDYMLDENEELRNSLLPVCEDHDNPVPVYSVHSFTLMSPSLESIVKGARGQLRVDMRVKGLDAVIKMTNYLQRKRGDIWDELGLRVIADGLVWPRVLVHLVNRETHNLTPAEWKGLGLMRAHWYQSPKTLEKEFMAPFPKYREGSEEIDPEYQYAAELSNCIIPDNKRDPWSPNIFDSKIRFIEAIFPRGIHAGARHLHVPMDVHFMTHEAWGRYVNSEYAHPIYKARAYGNIIENWDLFDWAVFNRLAQFWVDDYQRPFAEALYKNSAYYKSTQLAH